MILVRWVIALVPVLVLGLMAEACMAEILSKQEVDVMWEELLRNEQYKAIQYLNRRYSTPTSDSPTDDKKIIVQEGREGHLGGLFGLSEGGGWKIDGKLEGEVLTKAGVLQLYSKGVSHWSPGFVFPVLGIIWYPGYDPKHYPIWEFRLILRNPVERLQIQALRSVFLQPGDVLPTFDERGHSIKELVGQRVPRGELRYDSARQVAVIQILGVHHPVSVEVPLAQPPSPVQEKGRVP